MQATSRRRLTAAGSALALCGAVLFLGPAGAAHAATAQAMTASCSQDYLPLPDPSCTPGVFNPDVTQDTIDSTICVSGWTSTIRPSTSYTNALKIQRIAEYGYSDTNAADYEEDHFILLELGGAPKDPQNLWPEPRYDTGGRQAAVSRASLAERPPTVAAGRGSFGCGVGGI